MLDSPIDERQPKDDEMGHAMHTAEFTIFLGDSLGEMRNTGAAPIRTTV